MTIVGGALPGLFEKGDYLLIDSVDFIVVKPASKTFFARQNSTGSAAMDSLLPGSMRIVVRDIIARLDTAGTDSIAGFASQHFRMSVSYAIAVDISRAMPSGIDVPPTPMLTTITTDYWYADVPGIQAGVPGTVTRARSGSMGPMRDVTDAIAEASRGLPRAKSLVRVKTATQWTGNGTSGGSESIFGIADFRRLQVDQVQMRLPDDFRETAFPGTTLLSGHQRTPTDGGARWRR